METTKEVLQAKVNAAEGVLYMALELSAKKWVVGFGGGGLKVRRHEQTAGDWTKLMELVRQAKRCFGLEADAKVMCCYEAGREGFWVHRKLVELGIENIVVDSSSIEVSRRKRRSKTDRLDAGKLLSMLVRHGGGERGMWQVLRVPTVQEEDARRLHREYEGLKKERTRHVNRIGALLATHGVVERRIGGRGWAQRLARCCELLGPHLARELERESARVMLVNEQMREIEAEQRALLAAPARGGQLLRVLRLARLMGIGVKSAWILIHELFWRRFSNRREVASCAGLTGTPYQSGETHREQGISKAGNKRVRWLMVELAWSWLRYQPHSELSRWYARRFAGGGARLRRIGIVALARRLLIAIWRYVEQGVMPAGACLKAA